MADVSAMRDLLPVQALDTRAAQLRHRREHMDLRQDLKDRNQSAAAQQQTIDEIAGELKTLRSAQKEAEDHASLISDRADAIDRSLYDGTVTDPKELGSLQQELAQLRANQDNFETQALEIMEEADPVEGRLDEAKSILGEITAGAGDVEAQIVVAEAEIDAELDQLAAERSEVSAGLDPELLAAYELLATQLGGIAVAELSGRRCGGCHLELPSAQAEAIHHATTTQEAMCPECGCMLVG